MVNISYCCSMCRECCVSFLISFFCHYDTSKILSIKNMPRAIPFRILQIIVLISICLYIIFEKKYQKTETGTSAITSKVKGVSFTNNNDRNVWDEADYIVPPLEDNAFFITTNALFTKSQTQTTCPQDPENADASCKTNADCKAFETNLLHAGVKTGICLKAGVCEVYAWCPVESSKADAERIKTPLLKNVNDFTVFIKNNIEFKEFKVSTSNIQNTLSDEQITSCRFDPVNNPLCPVFSIGTILSLAKTNYEDIAKLGGVISFTIKWDCNLDFNVEKCFPTYSFSRLDVDRSNISKGWNFRYANYYYINGVQHRDLVKVYGIRFIISVISKGGKFDPATFFFAVGATVSYFAIASIICELFYFRVGPDRQWLSKLKYEIVDTKFTYKDTGTG